MSARTYLAIRIVRWVGAWFDREFTAHFECQFAYSGVLRRVARLAEKIGLPLALRLDREAAAQQMVEECWWG